MTHEKKPREEQPDRDKPPEERDYAEYEFDSTITEHKGFGIGDQIMTVEDGEFFSSDEDGIVVGFSNIPPASDPAMAAAFGNDPNGHIAIYVLIDGTDEPIEIKPEYMEVA